MKKLFSIITALALCLSLLPTTALAAESVIIDLSEYSGKEIAIDSEGYSIDDSGKVNHTGAYVLTGSTTDCSVTVNGTHSITLNNVNINTGKEFEWGNYGIKIASGNTTLTLLGTNTIDIPSHGGGSAMPIWVVEGTTLTINGDGILNAYNGSDGKACIGAYWDGKCGTININSGTINARGGGNGGAVIGESGQLRGYGTINITGGVVTCELLNGGGNPTGLGGSSVSITGGIVSATVPNSATKSDCILNDTVYGDFTLNSDLTIESDKTLTIPDGSSLTVASDVTLTVEGAMVNHGTVTNNGTIFTATEITGNGSWDGYDVMVRVAGSGTEDAPYRISNSMQLFWFADKVNQGENNIHGELTADIVINEGDVAGCNGTKGNGWRDWTPIAYYTGTFDGKGYAVSGIYFNNPVNNPEGLEAGLFGQNNGTVKNLGVNNSYINAFQQVGSVVGLNVGVVTNCYNSGSVSGHSYAGGVVGYSINGGVVENCYNTGTITGGSFTGGVVGRNHTGNDIISYVTNCYNTGTVTGSGAVVGGNSEGCSVTNCYYLAADSETDSIDGTTFKTSDQFASGEVAYLLQGEQATNVWGQDITGETANERDAYPVLGGARVNYGYISCDDDAEMGYTNGTATSERGHSLTYSASGNTITESCSRCDTVSNTATITAEDAVYNGSAHETAAVAYSQNWAGGELSPSYENNTDAGTATASITHGGKTASVNFTIAPKTVTAPVFTGLDANYPHTGEAIQPSGFTLKDNLDNVIPEDEYTVAYSNNTNVGTATITITDREGGNYIVSGTTTFEIVAHSHDWTYTASGATITATCDGAGTCGVGGTATVTLVAPENLVYDGNAKTVTISGSIENVDLPAIQYTGNCTDVGEHTATLTLGGATATLTFSVTEPAPTTSTVTVSNGGTGASGSGTYAEGETVTIAAGTKNNYSFSGWTSSDGVTFANASSATTTFTMPGNDVTVTANWTYLGGGGGDTASSTTTTTTTKNPDGSTTTTVTNKNTGTVTETTKNTDGSTTIVETKKDGTVTETNKTADGTTGTVVTDKNGSVTEITASVSDKAVKDAAKTEEVVTLPVEVPASTNTNDAPIVEVTLPKNSGSVKVEIPVEKVTPGSVAVIVKADGTEEIVSTSIPTENGVVLTVDGSTAIKIVDNAKVFSDVPANSYFNDAVAFASARGITGGTSSTTFSPDASCTRAQIVTFLWRAAGSPVVTYDMDFSDVSADAYYADAVRWAVSMGITTGTGDGTFSPDATCTRAQAMTFIYRNEQAQGGGMTGTWMFQNPFTDVSLETYYSEAVMWAVINSVTNGTGATTFSPNANCTRAQIVTFLYNYLVE